MGGIVDIRANASNQNSPHDLARQIFYAALEAVNPYSAVKGQISHILDFYTEGEFERLYLISFGKAAFLMTKAVTDSIYNHITRGILITKYGHIKRDAIPSNIEIYEAGHPIPDINGVEATKRVIELLKEADEKTMVLCLISGGGSALLVAPAGKLSLEDKQNVTDLLLKAGATIEELNTVRKHISQIKGGRFVGFAYPAFVLSLILSDVIGDKLDVIASGSTTPDYTTFQMAVDIINRYRLVEKIPATVKEHLYLGVEGKSPETPKGSNKIFGRVKNLIVGGNRKAATAAQKRAQEVGFETKILSTELEGEAREIGVWLARRAIETKRLLGKGDKRKICLISGGETTVTVKGNGKGGRNTELSLAFAIEIKGIDGITLLSAGTDGTDGPTDAAGAIVDGGLVSYAETLGLYPEDYLINNDSYNLFLKTGNLLFTGPTGTNVMDLQIILIEN